MKKWITGVLLALCMGGILTGCEKEAEPVLLPAETEAIEEPEASAEPKPEERFVYVDIGGAVQNPGVYRLNFGDRLYQAVELAGGMTEEAYAASVNLAREIVDGEQILVLTKEEAKENVSSAGETRQEAQGKVNINQADEAGLCTLSGIGPSKAAAIAAYRRENGGFQSIEEIKEVDGIGEGTYNKIKEQITVSG